jgi:hypothetical protein
MPLVGIILLWGLAHNARKTPVSCKSDPATLDRPDALFTGVPRSRENLTYLCGCPLASSRSLRFSRFVCFGRLKAL